MRALLNNTQRITLVCFLAYFVMSGMLAPIGIISGPMAEHFGRPITEITAKFGWLAMGNLTGAVLALFLFDFIQLKKLMVIVYALIAICLFSLNLIHDLTLSAGLLGIVGICSGLGLPGAALVISRTYAANRRASMLVITDGSFSVAGIVCSWLATILIARAFQWYWVYQFVALVAVTIVILTIISKFPGTTAEERKIMRREPWPLSVWLCVLALFIYTLGMFSMLWWLPNYAETQLGAPPGEAGKLVSRFWTGLFAAQLFVAWWVLKVGVRQLVIIAGISASLFSIPLWVYTDIDGLLVFATLWGIGNMSLLKVVLSFATEMVEVPTARLVSMLLLGPTVGTAISPWVSSQIVDLTNNHFVLQFGTGCYVVLALLLVAANRLSTSKSMAPAKPDE